MSYANQYTITIHKEKYENNFVQVGVEEIQEAARNLSKAGLCMYLWLATHKDGFNWEMSAVKFEKDYGIKKTQYYEAVKELVANGYIIEGAKHKRDFYTRPFSGKPENEDFPENRNQVSGKPERNSGKPENFSGNPVEKHINIYNIQNTTDGKTETCGFVFAQSTGPDGGFKF